MTPKKKRPPPASPLLIARNWVAENRAERPAASRRVPIDSSVAFGWTRSATAASRWTAGAMTRSWKRSRSGPARPQLGEAVAPGPGDRELLLACGRRRSLDRDEHGVAEDAGGDEEQQHR